jgi:S1-C subfamily serine protease
MRRTVGRAGRTIEGQWPDATDVAAVVPAYADQHELSRVVVPADFERAARGVTGARFALSAVGVTIPPVGPRSRPVFHRGLVGGRDPASTAALFVLSLAFTACWRGRSTPSRWSPASQPPRPSHSPPPHQRVRRGADADYRGMTEGSPRLDVILYFELNIFRISPFRRNCIVPSGDYVLCGRLARISDAGRIRTSMTEDPTIKQLYRKAIPSVVSVYVTGSADDPRHRGGAGSGFVYDDDGYAVTNQHVVGDTAYVELRFSDGQWRTGDVVGTDPYTDLAVVHVDDLPAEAVALPVTDTTPETGERVAAIGNPMGLDGTITVGYVSGTNRSTLTGSGFSLPETIQTDAAVNPGNSGGPLLTLDGTVVGVNRAKAGDNIGFAIGPRILNRVVPALVEDGVFRPAYLNVRTVDVSPTVAEANQFDDPGGVLVVDVGTEYAGTLLRGCDRVTRTRGRDVPIGGDVIVGIDGRPVRSTEELTSYLLTQTAPDESVELSLSRDGTELTETVTLNERPVPGSRPRRGPGRRRGSTRGRGRRKPESRSDDDAGGSRNIPIG